MSQRPERGSLHLPKALPDRARSLLQTAIASPIVGAHTVTMSLTVVTLGRLFPALREFLLRAWCSQVLFWGGIDLSVEGTENLDPDARYIYVSNHASHLDVPAVLVALPKAVRFVAKRELFRIPFFGQAIRSVGTVGIDRNDRADTLRKLHAAQEGVARRCSVHFFAEGTRGTDGTLRPFKKGAVAMALALQVPLVPVAIVGTRRAYPKGAIAVKPGPVLVQIGRPIPVGPEDTAQERQRLLALVRDEVKRMLAAQGELVGSVSQDAPEVAHGG
jgi:1-acyl-sn-glycerol-3-phosphate acyltransferase